MRAGINLPDELELQLDNFRARERDETRTPLTRTKAINRLLESALRREFAPCRSLHTMQPKGVSANNVLLECASCGQQAYLELTATYREPLEGES